MPKLQELMTKDPVTLSPDTTVFEAAQTMRERGIGDVLVFENGDLSGIVTDRDIVVRAIAEGKDPKKTKVSDVASKQDLVTLPSDEDSEKAVELMRKRNIRRLPVTENGRPVGIVSIGDLAVEKDPNSALADISAAPPNN